MPPAVPPSEFYVVATDAGEPPRKLWLLGPYPDRPAAEGNRIRAVGLAAKAAAPVVNVRVASAPLGVAIATAFGA